MKKLLVVMLFLSSFVFADKDYCSDLEDLKSFYIGYNNAVSTKEYNVEVKNPVYKDQDICEEELRVLQNFVSIGTI